ncbi:MAG: hypothetical protein MUC43_19070, partial [Pirellula sp.]|nr:hypothetical protein [Pirellula sp.]
MFRAMRPFMPSSLRESDSECVQNQQYSESITSSGSAEQSTTMIAIDRMLRHETGRSAHSTFDKRLFVLVLSPKDGARARARLGWRFEHEH